MSKFNSVIAAMLLFSSLNAQSPQIEFEEYELDNGLKVLLHENHTTPIVAVSVMYHVGAKNEQPDRTGFAHFFEHLLFITFVLLKHRTHVTFGILNEKIYSIYNCFSNIFKC